MMPLLAATLALGLSTAPVAPAPASATPAGDTASERIPGEDGVFTRYLAPCCWQQTLDVHASSEAVALRAEIRERLRAGDSREAIEGSLVERYGPRIVATPAPGRIAVLGPATLALSLAAFSGAVLRCFVRRRRSESELTRSDGPERTEETAALDGRIDEALADLEG
jgi:cytochrome c-type biogenesis protein CcmH